MYKLKELVRLKGVPDYVRATYPFGWGLTMTSCMGKIGKVKGFIYDQGRLIGIKVYFNHAGGDYIFRIQDVEEIPSYYLKYIY